VTAPDPYMPWQRQLVPEIRAVNVFRVGGLIFFAGIIAFASVVGISQGVSGSEHPSRIAFGVFAALSAIVIVLGTCFRWVPLVNSARLARVQHDAIDAYTFARARSSKRDPKDTFSHGWLLLTEQAISIWEADSTWSSKSGARKVVEHALSQVRECSCAVQWKGRAYSWLQVELVDGEVLEFALTNPTGSSARGVSDSTIEQIAAQIEGLIP
jgi:hypothetical protein